jgi:hypothetical protein
MTLRLNKEMLAACYDFVVACPPFDRWNLPPSEDVVFKVIRSNTTRGWYTFKNGRHTIAISQNCVGHTISLLSVMMHEVLHLHQKHNCLETSAMHNAAFQKDALRICKIHGFDPALF